MFVVDLYLTFSCFVSFVHDYRSDSLQCLLDVDASVLLLILLMLVGPCVTGYVLTLLLVSLRVVI